MMEISTFHDDSPLIVPENGSIISIGTRPMPPDSMIDKTRYPEIFKPAHDVHDWAFSTLVSSSSPMWNPDHAHLSGCHVGFLWTNVPNSSKMKGVAGEARMPKLNADKWTKARLEYQLCQWFGEVPTFIITLDAVYAARVNNLTFAFLCDHELTHCGQLRDEFGDYRYRQDGTPIYGILGHCVEEFIPLQRRYGMDVTGTREFVEASLQKPQFVFDEEIEEITCGTCK